MSFSVMTWASSSRFCQAEPSRSCAYCPRRSLASASSRVMDSWQQEMLVGLEGLVHLGERALVAGEDAGVVHHLPEAHHGVPAHGLADVLGINLRTGVLKAWHRRDARARRDHALERHARGVADELLERGKPGDVHGLVRVPADSRGTVRNHRAGVLGGPHHGGLNVDVSVHEARCHVAAGGIDDRGLLADAVLAATAMSASSRTSCVVTLTSRAWRMTRSAGSWPWATRMSVRLHSHNGLLQKWLSMTAPLDARLLNCQNVSSPALQCGENSASGRQRLA